MRRPRLAITMGDPAGVGPELAVRVAADPALAEVVELRLVGAVTTLQEAARQLGCATPRAVLEPAGVGGVYPRGRIDAACGEAAWRCVAAAVGLALAGEVDAVVTNPLHKEALRAAGHLQAGHTEILRDLTAAPRVAMMLVGEGLRVVHTTVHCSLREAVEGCRRERIVEVLQLADAALRELGLTAPRLGMAGLNPHAGEGGLFGREELEQIRPACEAARAAGIDVGDPLPADTIFPQAVGGRFDAVVVHYHDQGHIPAKLRTFQYDAAAGGWGVVAGVNITLGLPIIRTSVDHGTAFDQAWQGTASDASLREAILCAATMATSRQARP
ncbi:MAG: 4-hydroxythreonine-4-phosphate dehydrogenase PdxA [Fimbriimonadaceae bacterium]|nr:4-hydroxythreonine-4-phosphate dehydrogenase PdxA [Fimbriimonadaceae bacterium]